MEGTVAKVFGASIALLAGYAFLKVSYLRRFSTEHLRTDRYALHLLGVSLALYVLGDFAAAVIPEWTPEALVGVKNDAIRSGLTEPVVNSIIFGILFGLADNLIVRFEMRNDPAMLNNTDLSWRRSMRLAAVAKFVCKCSDAKLRTLFRALMLCKRVMITMKSGKVYVGEPRWPDVDPAYQFASMKLVPFASGARDKDTKRLRLTTAYNRLVDSLKLIPGKDPPTLGPENVLRSDLLLLPTANGSQAVIDIEDFGVVITWSEVETFTIFDGNVFEWFQAQPASP